MRGPHSVFRGKVRQPLSMTMTREGTALLEAFRTRISPGDKPMSRGDAVEALVRRYAPSMTREDVLALSND